MTEHSVDNPAHKWWGQSPTSMGTFNSCPLSFKEKYLLKKYPFQPSEASMYGDRFHAASENRLLHDAPEPAEFVEFKPVFDQIRSLSGKLYAEVELATDRQWQPVPYKAWGKKDLGCKIDVLSIDGPYARIIDWKTGKRYDDPLQIDINAVMVFANFPDVQRIRAKYMYTKTGQAGMQKDYFRSAELVKSGMDENISRTRGEIQINLTRMRIAFSEDRFPPRKNGLCKNHCPVRDCYLNGHYAEWLRENNAK